MRLGMCLAGGIFLGSLALPAAAQETAAPAPDRVEMMQASLAASQAALKQYEWVRTIALSLSGEEKVRQQYQCYYGADGVLQKIPVAADAQEEKKRGLRGKVAESKKAELQASLKAAVQALDQYSPLDPKRIEAAKAAGNVSVSVPSADGLVRVIIKSYLKPGDEVIIQANASGNTLQEVAITSFVEDSKGKSPVSGKVSFAALEDGTIYSGKEVLEIPAQTLKVDVQNSGYRKHAK